MTRFVQVVRILIELDTKDGEPYDLGHEWLKENLKNRVDFQQGEIYLEDEGPLQ